MGPASEPSFITQHPAVLAEEAELNKVPPGRAKRQHPIVRMGRKRAASLRVDAARYHEEINERLNWIRSMTMKADLLEEWLDVYEASEPGAVRQLSASKIEKMLGIQEDE